MTTDLSDDDLVRRLRRLAAQQASGDDYHQGRLLTADDTTYAVAASRIEQLGSEVARLKAMFDRERDFKWLQAQRAQSAESRLAEVTEALQRFRDFVAENGGVRNSTTMRGEPTNHHNRIWAEIADLLAALSTPATPPSREPS